jgi:enoyl-CoA hydratase
MRSRALPTGCAAPRPQVADTPGLRVEGAGEPIWTVTLDRPHRRNALAIEQLAALPAVAADAEQRGARALVLTGAGTAFGAGIDIADLSGAAADGSIDTHLAEIADRFAAAPFLTVGAVEGPCIGASLDLALGLDVLVAGESAFFELPAVRYGLLYRAAAVQALAARAGPQGTAAMLLLGTRVPAERALRMGLVAEVVPDGTALERATELCREALAGVPEAMVASKRMLRALAADDFRAEAWDALGEQMLTSAGRADAVAAAKRRHT